MDRLVCLKHKIVFLEDVINGTFEVDAISKAGEYWNVIKLSVL